MARMSWEYLAGFFDGEGTIRLSNRATHWSIAQSQDRGRRALEEIQRFLGDQGIPSGIHVKRRRDGMYTLWISKRASVERIGRATLPYLRIKKVEMQDALRYLTIYPLLQAKPRVWSMLMKERLEQTDRSAARRRAWVTRRTNTSAGLPDPVRPSS